jgi:thioredoxin-related protein
LTLKAFEQIPYRNRQTANIGKHMKKLLIGLLACGSLSLAQAEELHWMTDLPKAQEQAKKEHKMVMLDFTGSDWCGWCIKLNKEVFSKPEFAEYAKKNLVLVEVDFPRHKELPKAQKDANEALSEKYKITGFPTIVVLDGEGKKVGELGYESSPKPFIEKLQSFKKS